MIEKTVAELSAALAAGDLVPDYQPDEWGGVGGEPGRQRKRLALHRTIRFVEKSSAAEGPSRY